MIPYPRKDWLRFLASPRGTFSPGVPARVLAFGAIALGVWVAHRLYARFALPVGLHEVAGAVLALLLAFRFYTGYHRFWEGRTLWGGLVNASRSLHRVVSAHAEAPPEALAVYARWIVVFAHATRRALRSEESRPEIARLLSDEELVAFAASGHRPMHAAAQLSARLHRLVRGGSLDPMLAQRAEQHVGELVACLGGCERILKTPTPLGMVLLLQRALVLFLASLPAALIESLGILAVLVTMMVAYLALMIEALGAELDNPFGHEPNDLPLTRICDTIERNLLGSTPLDLVMASTPNDGYED